MRLWKVELSYCYDRSSNVVSTYYFKTEQEAKDFVDKGNAILHKSQAYYCYELFVRSSSIDIMVDDTNVELEKLEKQFKGYKY